jgi:hypothetical protein
MLDILCRLTQPLTHIGYALLLIVPKRLVLMQLSRLAADDLRGLQDEQEIKNGVPYEREMTAAPSLMLSQYSSEITIKRYM